MPDVLVVGCRSTSTTTCGAVKKCTTKTLLCCRSVWVLCVPLWKEAGWGGYNQISISLWFLLSRQYVLNRITIWNQTLYGCVLSQTGVTLEDWMTAFKVKVHRIQLRKWLWSLSFDLFNYFLCGDTLLQTSVACWKLQLLSSRSVMVWIEILKKVYHILATSS